jgi:hypothetical protein
MRLTFAIILTAAALFGACGGRPARAADLRPRVAPAERVPEDPAGRARLRVRLADAARDFCARHADEVTPHESRADPYYCPDMARSWIVGGMSRAMRQAYAQARREAGVRGRRL